MKKYKSAVFLCIWFFVFCVATASSAATPQATYLTLSIAPSKNVYTAGEDIDIALEFKNVSKDSISLVFDAHGLYAFFTFHIKRNGQVLTVVRALDRKDMVFRTNTVRLQPGETHSMHIRINKLDWDDHALFIIPGMYEISITYGLQRKSYSLPIASNAITIEIVQRTEKNAKKP